MYRQAIDVANLASSFDKPLGMLSTCMANVLNYGKSLFSSILAIDDERPVEAAEVGDGKRPQAVESSAEDRLQCADVKATEHQSIEHPVNPVTVVCILYTCVYVCMCVHTYICVYVIHRQAIDVANLAPDEERAVEPVADWKQPQSVKSNAENRLQCADVKALRSSNRIRLRKLQRESVRMESEAIDDLSGSALDVCVCGESTRRSTMKAYMCSKCGRCYHEYCILPAGNIFAASLWSKIFHRRTRCCLVCAAVDAFTMKRSSFDGAQNAKLRIIRCAKTTIH